MTDFIALTLLNISFKHGNVNNVIFEMSYMYQSEYRVLRMKKNILFEGANLSYYSDFLSKGESDAYFEDLMMNTPWRHDKITVFGKTYDVPRLQAWYGDAGAKYSYSSINLDPLPWTDLLLSIKTRIEKLAEHQFNSVLVNLYRDGKDSNGWHSDDERELGRNPIIASVTLGQERVFHFKHKTKAYKQSILLEHGSLLVMDGETQHHWKHQIPKSAKPLNPRINLTFRKIYT